MDRLRQFDPLDDSTFIFGIQFSKSTVMHKGDTLWLETKVRFEKNDNGTTIVEVPTEKEEKR